MKKIFCLVFFALFSFLVFAQDDSSFLTPDMRSYEDALELFYNQDYGQALKMLNSARQKRNKRNESEVRILENAFKPAEVKYAGQTLTATIPVIVKREDYDALKIINKYLKIYGIETFQDNSQNLIQFIKNQKSFPEADYLTGKIYMIDGEYSAAEKYFKSAYENASNLQIPDEKYDILTSLVELSEYDNNYSKVEEYLLLILSKDEFYRDKSKLSAVLRIISEKNKSNVSKFFVLFRSYNFEIQDSYFKLASFYEEKGEDKKALEVCSLGVINGFTKILELIKKRNPDFEYESAGQVLTYASRYDDIVEWGIKNNLWASFNKLAELAFKNKDVIFACQLYKILTESNPEEYWKNDAKMKIIDLLVE